MAVLTNPGFVIWRLLAALGVFLAVLLVPLPSLYAAEPFGELSLMGSYSKTDYGNGSYSASRRYSVTLGYNFTTTTEIEISYSISDSFFDNDPYQTTSINEQALGLSIVQSLVPRSWYIQPYVKVGAAQYNREQSGTIGTIPTTSTSSKSPSGLLGGGVRVYLLRNFSLKVEGVTYLPDMQIAEANKNFAVQGGAGWEF